MDYTEEDLNHLIAFFAVQTGNEKGKRTDLCEQVLSHCKQSPSCHDKTFVLKIKYGLRSLLPVALEVNM
jgi:hypothetical protein